MCDHFDFYVSPFGQRGYLYGRPRGKIRGKILRVDFVHSGKVSEVRQKNRALYDVCKSEFLIIEDCFYILQNALRLGFDITLNQVA